MHIAAQCDNEPVVRLLLRYNATPSIRDAHGRTPQMVASKIGHEKLANLLGETELAKTLSGWSAETQTSGFNSGPQSPTGSPVGTGKKALINSNSQTFFNTQSSSRSNYTTGDESVPEREDFAQILMEKSAVKTPAGLLLDYRPSFGSNCGGAAGPKRPRIRTNPRVKPSPSAQKYHGNNMNSSMNTSMSSSNDI